MNTTNFIKKILYNNKFNDTFSKQQLNFLNIEKRGKKNQLLEDGIEVF